MSGKRTQWVVRDVKGRIYGPFSAQKVGFYIERGHFTGKETVAIYPSGRWQRISKVPEFYDLLLRALDPQKQSSQEGFAAQSLDEMSRISEATEASEQSKQALGQAVPVEDWMVTPPREGEPRPEPPGKQEEHTVFVSREELLARLEAQQSDSGGNSPEASENDFDPEEPRAKRIDPDLPEFVIARGKAWRRWALPAAVGTLGSLGLVLLFSSGDPQRVGGAPSVKLLVPKKGSPQSSPEERQSSFQRALTAFAQDSLEGYQAAQNELVRMIERAPKQADALGLLCMTHKELWVYTDQRTEELQAIRKVSQRGYETDVLGVNGAVCRITELILSSRTSEALTAVDSTLESFPSAAVLYQLRAELLGSQKKYEVAADYAQKTLQLWPSWLKPYVLRASYLREVDRYGEADQMLRKVLLENPNHHVAKVELGILQLEKFHAPDRALDYLVSAIQNKNKMGGHIQARAHQALAEIFFSKGDREKAALAAKNCLELSRANNVCRSVLAQTSQNSVDAVAVSKNKESLFLGDQYAKSGDCFAAQAEYKAAFEADPTNGVAAMRAGKCLWELSYSKEAVEWLERAVKADPKLTEAFATLADYYAQRYDYDSAYRILGQILRRFPRDYRVYQGFGLVELRRRNYKNAFAYFDRARKLYSGDVDTFVYLTQSLMGLEKYGEAFEMASRSLEIDLNNVGALCVYAKALGAAKNIMDGVNFLRERINAQPGVLAYRVTEGELYMMEERYEEARAIFRSLVEAGFENKKVYLDLGEMEQQKGNIDDALRLFLRAAAIDPTDAEPFFKAGVLYFENKKFFSARAHFEKALQANPRYPSAHYFLGRVALEYNNIQLALEEATKERRMNPNLADSYILAAEAYSRNQMYRECASEYQRAIKIRPQGSDIYIRLAKCYRQAGNLEVALSMLKTAAGQDSGNPEIYREQGAIYQQKGDGPAAVEAYNRYLNLAPSAVDRDIIERTKASIQ